MRFWRWLTDKPYGCNCGETFRNDAALSRHNRGHYQEAKRRADNELRIERAKR